MVTKFITSGNCPFILDKALKVRQLLHIERMPKRKATKTKEIKKSVHLESIHKAWCK